MKNLVVYTLISAAALVNSESSIGFTLTNTINYRFHNALLGIAGIVLTSVIMGVVSASGLGIIFATAPSIIPIIKILGYVYLVCIGIKIFMSKLHLLELFSRVGITSQAEKDRLFSDGFILACIKHNPIMFYLAVFPQFIDPTQPMAIQFARLIGISVMVIFMTHYILCQFADSARRTFFIFANHITGAAIFVFGMFLLMLVHTQ